MGAFFGGIERIRTAVQAFAELCLATRPRCLLNTEANVIKFLFSGLCFYGL